MFNICCGITLLIHVFNYFETKQPPLVVLSKIGNWNIMTSQVGRKQLQLVSSSAIQLPFYVCVLYLGLQCSYSILGMYMYCNCEMVQNTQCKNRVQCYNSPNSSLNIHVYLTISQICVFCFYKNIHICWCNTDLEIAEA